MPQSSPRVRPAFSSVHELLLARLAARGVAGLVAAAMACGGTAAPSREIPMTIAWSGQRAMNDISTQLSFGVRALDSRGHERTVGFIVRELAATSARVSLQQWSETEGSETHHLTNIIARFDPKQPRRILLGTHYDSIARAYRDSMRPNAPMPGANNSASGVALLLETARVLSASRRRPNEGVDIVFFDAEEGPKSLGAGDPQWRALGSPYFARHIEENYLTGLPTESIIFDMVCYRRLQLFPEASSLQSEPDRVRAFWRLGREIAPSIFLDAPEAGPIGDDQTALIHAGIPSDLIIGFDYDPWFNTTKDTVDKCSASSLSAVGTTLLAYLFSTDARVLTP